MEKMNVSCNSYQSTIVHLAFRLHGQAILVEELGDEWETSLSQEVLRQRLGEGSWQDSSVRK